MKKDNPKSNYFNKLHKDILTIMDEIVRISKAHHIRYYLMAGTCLGAIRHKGFIPWDDDLDIAMPREDFNRFISLTETHLDDRFYLRWITTEKKYNHLFAKICLKGTVFEECIDPTTKEAGIYVDIFPLDLCKSDYHIVERKNRIISFIFSIIYSRMQNGDVNIIKSIIRYILATIFPNKLLHKLIIAIIGKCNIETSSHQVFFCTPYPINRMFFPCNWHGEGRVIQFEDRQYVCPSKAESYLKQIYGERYMELPPENKRKTHYPVRVVFSDGEEMTFEKVDNMVTYRDVIE